jgi:dienelactone hydrolase
VRLAAVTLFAATVALAQVEQPATVADLPGTLVFPAGKGPFPALVIVHGSGAADRDLTFGPNKPYRDIAMGLAARGIAALRYDKRTKVHPEQFTGHPFTVKEETIDDALAAVALLRKTEHIDPKRIYVLGHSLGGMLVPRIGKADPAIAGFVIAAGNTRSFEELILDQLASTAPPPEMQTEEMKAQIEKLRQEVAKIKEITAAEGESSKLVFGAPAAYWLDMRAYDPAVAAKGLKQPLLIVQGERDYQVTMKDFERWKAVLSGRASVTFKTYPALNHLFMAGEGKSTPAEYVRPGHVSEQLIEDVAGWVKAH